MKRERDGEVYGPCVSQAVHHIDWELCEDYAYEYYDKCLKWFHVNSVLFFRVHSSDFFVVSIVHFSTSVVGA